MYSHDDSSGPSVKIKKVFEERVDTDTHKCGLLQKDKVIMLDD